MSDPSDPAPVVSVEETPIIDEKSGEVVAAESTLPHVTYEKEDIIPEAAQVFEETPTEEHAVPQEPPPQEPQQKKSNHLGTIIVIVLLFGLGVWLSTQLRSFFSPSQSAPVVVPTSVPIATLMPTPATGSAQIVPSSWVTQQIISGVTGTAISGISYKLPSNVTAPTCDGVNCPSEGTSLPGGTRFTVAPRGKGQVLPDFRGAILTDANGKEFTMQQTVIGGIYCYEYTGDFTGYTGGGYTFTKMRGVLIPVNSDLSIEFNHFSPGGTTADFASDDTLFNSIVGTFISTIPSATPTATPVATSSAY